MDLFNATISATMITEEEEAEEMQTALTNPVQMGTSRMQQINAVITIGISLASSILSLILNTLNIMVATNKHFNLPVSNCVGIVSMSLADMIIGLATIVRFSFSFWQRIICRVHLVFSVTGVRVSVVSLILIIVDRYVAIIHPFRHQRYATKKFCIVLVVVMWILTAFANILENATGSYFYDPNRRICDVQLSLTRLLVSTILVYFVPLSTMLVIYMHLLVVVRQLILDMNRIHPVRDYSVSNRVTASTNFSNFTLPEASIPGPSTNREMQGGDIVNASQQNDHTGQFKLILTFFAVTAAFTVTTVPNRIVRLMAIFKGPLSVSPGLTLFCRILVISGSWLNFFIFSVMNHNFRLTLKHIFRRRCAGHCHC
ncbi:histamine H2 receptor-like [Lytechinus pictus]|uniref:histamine H2 receptor-like n=1 Tax=Lytechinus pictus TaxID=7653 RepID=UPI0030B9DA7F